MKPKGLYCLSEICLNSKFIKFYAFIVWKQDGATPELDFSR